MPETQLQLTEAVRDPLITGPLVTAFVSFLSDGLWHTAREVREKKGWDERTTRAVANASQGQIISGQSGYKLTRKATIEEIDYASNWLLHQAKEMARRAGEIQAVRNGKTISEDAATANQVADAHQFSMGVIQ